MAKNFIQTQIEFIKNIKVKDLNQNQRIGLAGALILLLGIFFPILQLGGTSSSLSNTSISMFKNGASTTVSTGIFALLISITVAVSIYFILHKKNKFVILSNLVATLLYLYSLLNTLAFANDLNRQQAELQKQIQSSIFGSGIASSFSGLIKSYDINWLGWLVMILGIAAIFYSVKADLLVFSKEVKTKATKVAQDLKSNEKTESAEVKVQTETASNQAIEVKDIKKDESKVDSVNAINTDKVNTPKE